MTWTDKLKHTLFNRYDKYARPNENLTKVDLRLTVRHLDIDEDKSTMTIFAWLKMVNLRPPQ